MRTALHIALYIAAGVSLGLLVYFGIKWLKWPKKGPQESSFEIHPNDIILDEATLKQYGFRIYPTKDKIYSTHPNGISLEYVEGLQWICEIRHNRTVYRRNIYSLGDLLAMCDEYRHPIKQINDQY